MDHCLCAWFCLNSLTFGVSLVPKAQVSEYTHSDFQTLPVSRQTHAHLSFMHSKGREREKKGRPGRLY